MTKRKDVLAALASRAPGKGPQRRKRPLTMEDVDLINTYRKFDCVRYDECLGEMAIVGCRSWQCPMECPWHIEAPKEAPGWRAGEPEYTEYPAARRTFGDDQ